MPHLRPLRSDAARNPPHPLARRFLLGLAAAVLTGRYTPALAQGAAPRRIGYLSSKGPAAEAGIVAAVRNGLAGRGFVEGPELAIDFRWSDGNYDRLPALCAELVASKVEVLITSGLPATIVAKKATSTIPIVFRLAIDPVAFDLVKSLNRPGGNVTGVTMLFDPLTPKKLQLLRELVPGMARVGVLINPNNQNAASHRQHAERAAQRLGLPLSVLTAGTSDEIEAAFAAARQGGVGALLVGDDPFYDVSNGLLVETAARQAMPTMYYVRDFTVRGGLISYGPSFDEMARQVGDYAGRILKGANPAELPVGQPTKIEFVINLKTAKLLGLPIPPLLLVQASEVIE